MFGSYVINDLCLVLFPVAYVSAERLESSERRQNSGATTKSWCTEQGHCDDAFEQSQWDV